MTSLVDSHTLGENPWRRASLPDDQTNPIYLIKSPKTAPLTSHNTVKHKNFIKSLKSNEKLTIQSPKTPTSSYFDIESLSDTSPYFEYPLRIISPHEPPIDQCLVNSTIKHKIVSNRSGNDRFNHLMEDRMLRWNSSTSQYNIEPVITGTHPYQSSRACEFPTTSMFDSVRNWFRNEEMEQPQPILSNDSTNTHSTLHLSSNLEKIIGLNLKPNSSKSFLTHSLINTQYLQTAEPTYTPIALPIYDFNFDKTNKDPTYEEFESIDNILSNNFLASCFTDCWSSIINCMDDDSF